MDEDSKKKGKPNTALVFMGIGFELLGLVLGGLYFGQMLDKYYGLKGGGTLLVLFCCLISWGIHFAYLLKRFSGDPSTKK